MLCPVELIRPEVRRLCAGLLRGARADRRSVVGPHLRRDVCLRLRVRARRQWRDCLYV